MSLRNKLANLIRDNPTVKTIVTPNTWMYFPGGIHPIETSIHRLLILEKKSERKVEICLMDFSDCYLRANEIILF